MAAVHRSGTGKRRAYDGARNLDVSSGHHCWRAFARTISRICLRDQCCTLPGGVPEDIRGGGEPAADVLGGGLRLTPGGSVNHTTMAKLFATLVAIVAVASAGFAQPVDKARTGKDSPRLKGAAPKTTTLPDPNDEDRSGPRCAIPGPCGRCDCPPRTPRTGSKDKH